MQRTEDNQVIISCDFTGEDWDQIAPMIEGHRGSVISLKALDRAIREAGPADEPFTCTLCLREYDEGEKMWRHPDPPEGANADATICFDCIQQADRAFARDTDVDWERKLPPTEKWR